MTDRGRIWFFISVFSTVFLMFLFGTNCGSEEFSSAHDASEKTGSDPSGSPATSVELCMDRYSTPPGEVWLTPETPDADCPADYDMRLFELYENFPLTLALEGAPGIAYCLTVYLMRGYITVSHEEGSVTREGKLFTWCITATENVNTAVIRSLTAHSEIELLVP